MFAWVALLVANSVVLLFRSDLLCDFGWFNFTSYLLVLAGFMLFLFCLIALLVCGCCVGFVDLL